MAPSFVLRLYWSYELFLLSHVVLSAVVLAAVYVHIGPRGVADLVAVCMVVAVVLGGLTAATCLSLTLYRSLPYGQRGLNQAYVKSVVFQCPDHEYIVLEDVVQVHVALTRPWRARAGQYMYLRIPKVRLAQSHPFYVAWRYTENDGTEVAVFIVQARRGFTRRLLAYREAGALGCALEGPYGTELDLGRYGTALLMATGMGIAAQMPYVSRLLGGFSHSAVRTRKIALYWQIDRDSKLHRTLPSPPLDDGVPLWLTRKYTPPGWPTRCRSS